MVSLLFDHDSTWTATVATVEGALSSIRRVRRQPVALQRKASASLRVKREPGSPSTQRTVCVGGLP